MEWKRFFFTGSSAFRPSLDDSFGSVSFTQIGGRICLAEAGLEANTASVKTSFRSVAVILASDALT